MELDVAKVVVWSGSVNDDVAAIEGMVQNIGAHLEHQMSASWRPPSQPGELHPEPLTRYCFRSSIGQLIEQFDGLSPDDAVWDATTNREHLQKGDVLRSSL
jgi:hypothetical protein